MDEYISLGIPFDISQLAHRFALANGLDIEDSDVRDSYAGRFSRIANGVKDCHRDDTLSKIQ